MGYSLLYAYSRSMAIGDKLAFKHIPFNVKLQYPFNRRQVCVCARARSVLVRARYIVGSRSMKGIVIVGKGSMGTTGTVDLQVGMLVGGTGITPMIQVSVAFRCIAS